MVSTTEKLDSIPLVLLNERRKRACNLQFVQREGLFESFHQAGGRTRIQLVLIIVQPVECLSRISSVSLRVGESVACT